MLAEGVRTPKNSSQVNPDFLVRGFPPWPTLIRTLL